MKKIISILVALFMLFSIHSLAQQTEWEKAAQAYAENDYEAAVQIYKSLLEQGESVDLYYNYANALYKSGSLGEAILNYERALLIDPSNEDANFNLNFVNMQITDKIEPMEIFFLAQWLSNIETLFSTNTWSYLSIIFFILFLGSTLLYLFAKIRWIRKTAFFVSIALYFSFSTSITYAYTSRNKLEKRAYAIILSGSVSIKSSPNNSGTELFVLHEGTKLKIISSLGDWNEVETADGNIGWMPCTNLDRI